MGPAPSGVRPGLQKHNRWRLLHIYRLVPELLFRKVFTVRPAHHIRGTACCAQGGTAALDG